MDNGNDHEISRYCAGLTEHHLASGNTVYLRQDLIGTVEARCDDDDPPYETERRTHTAFGELVTARDFRRRSGVGFSAVGLTDPTLVRFMPSAFVRR